ncbi:c-type cytochrome [Gelidibacter salicanalis]|uniref:Cytochrome c n=1 Tax=Gelidibacter salicanalis TaxID=291193 RepID=A0A934KZQ6_9FLAO|nr:cytochrome c [Gelidibacter salicanalis]MBJ7882595.1 cytochrome c [Gelidibacter salicanalis]
MKTKKILISITFTGLLYVLLVGFINQPENVYEDIQQKKWVAPASADKIVNPLKDDANAAASGKKLYKAMCSVCHGPKGKGDGMAGAGLTPKPTDLINETFQSQSDGAIFWKIAEGRAPMASYKSSIPEKKRWEIINYIRTLK